MIGSSEYPMLAFGLPPSAPAWAAAIVALGLFVFPRFHWPRHSVWILAGTAALLSWGYFLFFLGGAPRIIDATTYLLEARAFSQGSVGFTVPDPSASFRGRFLIHTQAHPHTLAGIFPPGYPLLLSLGIQLGAYQLIGPLVAAAVVLLTYRLAWDLTKNRHIASTAAALSVACACLRYHHADTMSHGLSGLLTLGALWSTVRLLTEPSIKLWAIALGLCCGLLIATRQLTGAAILVACLGGTFWSKWGKKTSLRWSLSSLGLFALGLLPGIFLLLAHQGAVTGDPLSSVQFRYYAHADGPPGCFGLGLGKGCHYEHADVAGKMGAQGLDLIWALKNTFHRLHWHGLDIANFEPLALVAVYFAYRLARRPLYRPLVLALIVLPLAYSGFYFAGSYPGAGARFFSELLPLWHVILAFGLCTLRAASWGLGCTLLGFALHASYSHEALKSDYFGPPGRGALSLPHLLAQAKTSEPYFSSSTPSHSMRPLVFVASAHAFNLAWHAHPGILVARRTYDSRETLLAQHFSTSETWELISEKNNSSLKRLSLPAWDPTDLTHLVFESEFDYPPLNVEGLWVHPDHVLPECRSNGRALALRDPQSNARLTLETAGAPPGRYHVLAHLLEDGKHCRAESLGTFDSPKTITLSPQELDPVSHLDRIELVPVLR